MNNCVANNTILCKDKQLRQQDRENRVNRDKTNNDFIPKDTNDTSTSQNE